MRLEFFILLITGFLVVNIYHDGKYLVLIKSWKKYYQMAFYIFIGFSLYIFIKKYPGHGHSLFSHANSFVKFNYLGLWLSIVGYLIPVWVLAVVYYK